MPSFYVLQSSFIKAQMIYKIIFENWAWHDNSKSFYFQFFYSVFNHFTCLHVGYMHHKHVWCWRRSEISVVSPGTQIMTYHMGNEN